MSSHLIPAALVLVLAAGAFTYLYLDQPQVLVQSPAPAAASSAGPSGPAEPEARAPESAPTIPPAARRTAPARPRPLTDAEVAAHPAGSHVRLPDGSWIPVLNGALGAPPLPWTPGRPWSPILRLEVDPKGYQWYIHEDGTRSITHMTNDSRVQGQVPISNAFHPEKSLPVLDPDSKKK